MEKKQKKKNIYIYKIQSIKEIISTDEKTIKIITKQ